LTVSTLLEIVLRKDLVTQEPVLDVIASTVNKIGYVACANIAGGGAKFPGVVKASVTAYMNTIVVAMGFAEREARKRGWCCCSVC